MRMKTPKNLDSRINEYSYNMVNGNRENKEVINLIDKALGVLSNDGVYGYYVYCKSKDKKENKGKNQMQSVNDIEKIFVKNIVDEFKDELSLKFCNDYNINKNYDKFFIELSENLYSLLFFKDIIERILIYARYHAKALGDYHV